MSESVSSEFSSFLRLLTNDNDCRYLDDAKRLTRRVKEASESGLSLFERRRRIESLSVVCRELIFALESDRSLDYRYRIPLAVREMSLSSRGVPAKLILLGNFEIAVRHFEKPDVSRPGWSDNPPAA